MSDIIQLLPDHIANQIAAGEVIQRPASAVKELLENAVDAGATEIKLIIIDAGKTLLQVIDNGRGMSETDARMCFERHATSKIKDIEDLFRIKTMGFRGEALASIAAVAKVELKSKRAIDEWGTYIEVENSVVRKQEPCAAPNGTSISMKNLFFNVPARRNFLKSNAAEMRHIVDEFIRVALAFPAIHFSLTANNEQLFYLEAGNAKQRIVQIMGNAIAPKLVAVKEQTDYLDIHGFVGKPDAARKTRGEQYFFVNNRFIKSAYLNHAVNSAFEGLIAKDSFPVYALYIDLDPNQVDINVHPTKQEIKFEDEKIIYAFVQAAIKHALAQFNIAPSLDFELDTSIQQLDAVSKPFTEAQQATTAKSGLYQTFTQRNQAHKLEPSAKGQLRDWKDFLSPNTQADQSAPQFAYETPVAKNKVQVLPDQPLLQLHLTYIIASTQDGFVLVHQQLAHERILYDKLSTAIYQQKVAVQKTLFPVTIETINADAVLLKELIPDLQIIGFEIEHFGNNSFIIQGTPADVKPGNEKNIVELLLEQYKHFSSDVKFSAREKLIRCMSRQQSVKSGQALTQEEMLHLVNELFNCATPNITPNGSPTYIAYKEDYLDRMFSK